MNFLFQACLFVNVSPDVSNFSETVSTLNFGSNAKQIALGQAKQNIRKGPQWSAPVSKWSQREHYPRDQHTVYKMWYHDICNSGIIVFWFLSCDHAFPTTPTSYCSLLVYKLKICFIKEKPTFPLFKNTSTSKLFLWKMIEGLYYISKIATLIHVLVLIWINQLIVIYLRSLICWMLWCWN